MGRNRIKKKEVRFASSSIRKGRYLGEAKEKQTTTRQVDASGKNSILTSKREFKIEYGESASARNRKHVKKTSKGNGIKVNSYGASSAASGHKQSDSDDSESSINPYFPSSSKSKVRRDREKSKVRRDREKSKVRRDREKSKVRKDREKSKVRKDREKSKVGKDREKSKVRKDRQKSRKHRFGMSDVHRDGPLILDPEYLGLHRAKNSVCITGTEINRVRSCVNDQNGRHLSCRKERHMTITECKNKFSGSKNPKRGPLWPLFARYEEVKGQHYTTLNIQTWHETVDYCTSTTANKSTAVSSGEDCTDSDEFSFRGHDSETSAESSVPYNPPSMFSDHDSTIDSLVRLNEESIKEYYEELEAREKLRNLGCDVLYKYCKPSTNDGCEENSVIIEPAESKMTSNSGQEVGNNNSAAGTSKSASLSPGEDCTYSDEPYSGTLPGFQRCEPDDPNMPPRPGFIDMLGTSEESIKDFFIRLDAKERFLKRVRSRSLNESCILPSNESNEKNAVICEKNMEAEISEQPAKPKNKKEKKNFQPVA